MTPILSLLFAVLLSRIVIQVGTVTLRCTGLSRPLAQFQARSAFFLAGFTTNESEHVMTHPVRRSTIMLLMMGGYIGIGTVISSAVLSFVNTSDQLLLGTVLVRLWLILVGLYLIILVSHNKFLNKQIERVITWALSRYTDIMVVDYAGLLHISHSFIIAEITVNQDDWFCGKTLAELRLKKQHVLVLGIERSNGGYIGTPDGATTPGVNDTMIVYGPRRIISTLKEWVDIRSN